MLSYQLSSSAYLTLGVCWFSPTWLFKSPELDLDSYFLISGFEAASKFFAETRLEPRVKKFVFLFHFVMKLVRLLFVEAIPFLFILRGLGQKLYLR